MDEQRYGDLLALYRPRVIESADDHDAMLSMAETLMDKGEELAPEEEKLLALAVLLIEAFEMSIVQDEEDADEEEETVAPPTPHETLKRLLQSRELQVDDIVHVFGNPFITREVLAGKRPISRGQAKELGKFFDMPAKLFQGS